MGIAISTSHRGVVLSLLITALAPTTSFARSLQLSSEVLPKQVAILKQDLSHDLTLVDDASTKSVMGISDLSDRSLKMWLMDRVGYIAGENEAPEKHLFVWSPTAAYQNPGVFPVSEKPTKDFNHQDPSKGRVYLVMYNSGVGYYKYAKSKGQLLGYVFNSNGQSTKVPITSPRTGIIQVGEGLFYTQKGAPNPTSVVNIWARLTTLFHEAHHSDGNGTSLGFLHAVCPESKGAFGGFNACDRNSNGPYAVGAQIAKQATITCLKNKTCTAAEAELIKAISVDSHSRIIDDAVLDARPESVTSLGGSTGI